MHGNTVQFFLDTCRVSGLLILDKFSYLTANRQNSRSGEAEPSVGWSLHGSFGHRPHGASGSAPRLEGGGGQHPQNSQGHPVNSVHLTVGVSG